MEGWQITGMTRNLLLVNIYYMEKQVQKTIGKIKLVGKPKVRNHPKYHKMTSKGFDCYLSEITENMDIKSFIRNILRKLPKMKTSP